MKPIKYGKLVRDKVPEVILADGYTPLFRYAGSDQFRDLLKQKLVEEVGEFIGSESVLELADIYEVLLALADDCGYTHDELMFAAKQKREERGGFAQRVFLVEIAPGKDKPGG